MIAEFALFIFTTLGGLAAGLYALAALFPPQGKRANLLVSAVPLALLAVAGVALLSHLGHPERMFNAFANPAAGITQEGICTCLFGIALVADFFLVWRKGESPRALRWIGALFAFLLMLAMGLLYYNYESMPMWHALPTVPLFLLGDLAMGMLFVSALHETPGKTLAITSGILAAATAIAIAAEAIVFPASGLSPVPFVMAALIAGTVAAFPLVRGNGAARTLWWGLFAALFIAIVIARYAFYAAF